ncbi:MAG: hypothetical protein EXS37_20475 [Opitutus sp.]|nr:hypothetical protein [Opitutus sp.]
MKTAHTVQITTRIPRAERTQLGKMARAQGITLNDLVVQIIAADMRAAGNSPRNVKPIRNAPQPLARPLPGDTPGRVRPPEDRENYYRLVRSGMISDTPVYTWSFSHWKEEAEKFERWAKIPTAPQWRTIGWARVAREARHHIALGRVGLPLSMDSELMVFALGAASEMLPRPDRQRLFRAVAKERKTIDSAAYLAAFAMRCEERSASAAG